MSAALRTRPPTGVVPWPFVLLEGEEKAGKTYTAYLLSASKKVGQTYVLDLGEGSADEYGAIPDARFLVLEPDPVKGWTFAEVLSQLEAVRDEAARVQAAGEPPVVLVVDTMTDLWEGLKDWVTARAATSKANRDRIARGEEVKVPNHLWNDSSARNHKIIRLLQTFPGIVVVTARGKWVAEIGKDGNPVEGSKIWKVEGHKNLAYDASCWIRVFRDSPAEVIGLRSVRFGVRPGKDPVKPLPEDWSLEDLIFDKLGCDPETAKPRDIVNVTGGALTPDEVAGDPEVPVAEHALEIREAVAQAWEDIQALRSILDGAQTRPGLLDVLVPAFDDAATPIALGALIVNRGRALTAAEAAAATAVPEQADAPTA